MTDVAADGGALGTDDVLTVALSKGHICEQVLPLLAAAGVGRPKPQL